MSNAQICEALAVALISGICTWMCIIWFIHTGGDRKRCKERQEMWRAHIGLMRWNKDQECYSFRGMRAEFIEMGIVVIVDVSSYTITPNNSVNLLPSLLRTEQNAFSWSKNIGWTLWCPTLSWPSSFPQRLEHSVVKVTPTLTIALHLLWLCCLHPSDIRGSGRREEVMAREAGCWRVWHEVTPLWLLTSCDRFQLLLPRPFHVYDICTCVAPLTGRVTSQWHFSQNSCCLSDSPLRTHKCTWHWVHWTLTPHVGFRIQ